MKGEASVVEKAIAELGIQSGEVESGVFVKNVRTENKNLK